MMVYTSLPTLSCTLIFVGFRRWQNHKNHRPYGYKPQSALLIKKFLLGGPDNPAEFLLNLFIERA
jgi:hypothetical protein